jgi:hypothetical protein
VASSPVFDGGYVLLFRRMLENPVFRSDAEAMAFGWMVLKAAWKPVTLRYKGHVVELKRGQLAVSVRDMGDRLEWSKDRVYRFLNTLANRDMIATATATGVNIITICNYNDYQPSREQAATLPLFEARQDRDSTATQNNESNEGNEGRDREGRERAPRSKPGTQIPSDWKPDSPVSGNAGKIVARWDERRFNSVLDAFTDHHKAKGSVMKDWNAAFRKWVTNEDAWKGQRNGSGNGYSRDGSDGPANRSVRAAATILAERGASGSGR